MVIIGVVMVERRARRGVAHHVPSSSVGDVGQSGPRRKLKSGIQYPSVHYVIVATIAGYSFNSKQLSYFRELVY